MNQQATLLYFNRFALPTLTKLKQQRNVRGDFSLKVSSVGNTMESKFLFNDDWEVMIELAVNEKLEMLSVRMTGVNPSFDDVHSLHFHPRIQERDTWACLPAYEKAFHLHIYSPGKSKIVLKNEPDDIAFLFLFLAGRYYKVKHQGLQRLLKPGGTLDLGLSAAIG